MGELGPHKALPVLPHSQRVPELPVLSYPSGSGHTAGSDTSAEREAAQDADGTTAAIQGRVLDALKAHPGGMTWKEVDEWAKIGHHGRTSSALTHLRKAGFVFWLHEKRDGCHLFVHSMWRDRFPLSAVKLEEVHDTTNRDTAAQQLATTVDAYLNDPTIERWDVLRQAHTVWKKL